MEFGFTTAAYVVAAVLFILSLGGLSGQESAKRAVWYGIAGMALAVFARFVRVWNDEYVVHVVLVGQLAHVALRRLLPVAAPGESSRFDPAHTLGNFSHKRHSHGSVRHPQQFLQTTTHPVNSLFRFIPRSQGTQTESRQQRPAGSVAMTGHPSPGRRSGGRTFF